MNKSCFCFLGALLLTTLTPSQAQPKNATVLPMNTTTPTTVASSTKVTMFNSTSLNGTRDKSGCERTEVFVALLPVTLGGFLLYGWS